MQSGKGSAINVCGGWGHHGFECRTTQLKAEGKGGGKGAKGKGAGGGGKDKGDLGKGGAKERAKGKRRKRL